MRRQQKCRCAVIVLNPDSTCSTIIYPLKIPKDPIKTTVINNLVVMLHYPVQVCLKTWVIFYMFIKYKVL